jgi:steroid 5-alpha reductase family enzyme
MLPVAILHLAAGSFDGRAVLATASIVIYLLNMNLVILVWTKDTAMSKLDASLDAVAKNLLPVVMSNAAGWLYCLPFYFVGRRTGPLGSMDALALAIYALGTVVHFGADLQKRRFKANPAMKGRILDRGFWRYSRHPNYFGDLLVYIGWALLAGNPWAWLAPAANLAQYVLDAIPKSEKWAAERYGPAWSDYAARTSRLLLWPKRRPAVTNTWSR